MNYQECYDSYKELFVKDGKLTELGEFALWSLVICHGLSLIEHLKNRKEI